METVIIAVVQLIGLPFFGYIIYAIKRSYKQNKFQDIKITALVVAIQKSFDVNGFSEAYNESVELQMKEHNFVHFKE